MLLNDTLLDNKMRMPDTFKKSLVSAFGHLTLEDQKYITCNIEKFVPKGTKVYFPNINGHVPAFLVHLEHKLQLMNYTVDSYDISVENPAVDQNTIIVANDMSKLYCLLCEDTRYVAFINTLCALTYQHPYNLFLAFMSLSDHITKRQLDPFIYPDAMISLSIYYDTIATLTINSIGLRGGYMMQTQTRAFSYMTSMLKATVPGDRKAFSQEILLLELNILTSLVPVDEVKRNVQYLMSPTMINATIGEMEPSDVSDVLSLIKKRSSSDPFVANKFETYRQPYLKGFSFVADEKIRSTNSDLVELIENTTREKIAEIIYNNTGVEEDISNISFDIHESLLTMYQLEFSRNHPMIMVPITSESEIDRDGSDWRHIIHYGNEVLVAFWLKDSPKKLYAIHIHRHNDEDTNCTLVEFTGKENGNYEFVY